VDCPVGSIFAQYARARARLLSQIGPGLLGSSQAIQGPGQTAAYSLGFRPPAPAVSSMACRGYERIAGPKSPAVRLGTDPLHPRVQSPVVECFCETLPRSGWAPHPGAEAAVLPSRLSKANPFRVTATSFPTFVAGLVQSDRLIAPTRNIIQV